MTEAEAMDALKTGLPVRYRLPTISGEDAEHEYTRITKVIHHYLRGKLVTSAVIESVRTKCTVQCLITDLSVAGATKA